jgi:tRNA G18 (ribose-2'-O)-methylase SpoU
MQPIPVQDIDDPRIAHYRNVRDRVLRKDGNRFIIEGLRLLERAVAAGITLESVLTEPRQLDAVRQHITPPTQLYLAERAVMTRIAGLAIHTGVLSIGIRPEPLTLDQLIKQATDPVTLLVVPHIKETANLGALIRVAAAFSADGLIIGPECCDPFYRRAVRVSMGSAFTLPIARVDHVAEALDRLGREFGFHRIATVLDHDAISLADCPRPGRLAILLGHEVDGLADDLVARCDEKVIIPMADDTDSLNVSISAAVFVYHFTQGRAD